MSGTNDVRRAGPRLQFLNRLLHKEPFSFIVYGIYWYFFCCVLSPIAGFILLCWTLLRTIVYFISKCTGMSFGRQTKIIDPIVSNGDSELAVVITGCDSGFGKGLALALENKGFVVFAGVLMNESKAQYKHTKNIIAVQMDVTDDKQVQAVAKQVSQWIDDKPSQKQRYLHSLINNAGIGHPGLIDWANISAFKQDMEVNYFGVIRTVKAFYPLFKEQASKTEYNDARVVNIASIAGLVEGVAMSPYNGSKHAVEVLSSCLRHEMNCWKVKVVTVNPSFHETPMTATMPDVFTGMWNSLPLPLQKEYGEEFFKELYDNCITLAATVTWEADYLLEEVTGAVNTKNPPAQLVLGSDAKFMMLTQRHLPVWLLDVLNHLIIRRTVKPALLMKKTASKND